jgi:hypothetical protein
MTTVTFCGRYLQSLRIRGTEGCLVTTASLLKYRPQDTLQGEFRRMRLTAPKPVIG